MGIEFTKAYVANGVTYATLKEAQTAEIAAILLPSPTSDDKPRSYFEYAKQIVDNAERIIDALTTTEKSRPKARAVNGGRKPRKPKAAVTPQPEAQAAA